MVVVIQVVGGIYENIVDWVWFNVKSTKHVFCVVNGVVGHFEVFGIFDVLFVNVNIIDRVCFGALVIGNVCG